MFKNFLIFGLAFLSIALLWMGFNKEIFSEIRPIEVIFERDMGDESNTEKEYSEFWDKRPNGIGVLNMTVKLLPNVNSTKDSYLLGYKAEIALNSQAVNLKEREHQPYFSVGQYEVAFWFSLLDEDEFCLDLIYTKSDETSFIFTQNFLDLLPGGNSQIEQAIVTSKELAPPLAKRIKKVRVRPVVIKYGLEEENKTIKE